MKSVHKKPFYRSQVFHPIVIVMALFTLPKHKLLAFTLLIIIIFFFSGICKAEDNNNPTEMFQKALFCFNNKFIYGGCDKTYRLNEGGKLNVPPQAVELFCNGPCLAETELVLNCVDNIFSNFLFYNKATIGDIRGALNVGCTEHRKGLFNFQGFPQGNFGGFPQGEISHGERPKISSVVYALILLISGSFCFFL
ncbi:hypothetical protein G4B88_005436 [Cannabis sativa]|uniref:DUF7731 domain-containing protein n=1 Tax=Cannabis sativa TaxID=3483 RepID=A0A7J6HAZ1_CANSA|nr:hypothetical protein G4B88_005436 [Cannabis sativa]